MEKVVFREIKVKKGGQVDVALLYSGLQVGHCIMDGILNLDSMIIYYHRIRKTTLSGSGL